MKLITTTQANTLTLGDIISRYPYNGTPQPFFNRDLPKLTEVYEVRSVNQSTHIVELVLAASNVAMMMPSEVSRVFIHQEHLVSQQLWWMDETGQAKQFSKNR